MGKALVPPEPAEIHEVALREALEERYLAYALSTIMHRALPDARDGLKPVHRRILYGMRLLRLGPGAAFKKVAEILRGGHGHFPAPVMTASCRSRWYCRRPSRICSPTVRRASRSGWRRPFRRITSPNCAMP